MISAARRSAMGRPWRGRGAPAVQRLGGGRGGGGRAPPGGGDVVGGGGEAGGPHLERGHNVAYGGLEHLDRRVLGALGRFVHRLVDDVLGCALLSGPHYLVDSHLNPDAAVLGVRRRRTANYLTSSRHFSLPAAYS